MFLARLATFQVVDCVVYTVYTMQMVTVLSDRHLKYKVNENDHNPPHVHVEGGGASIRINLLTLEVMDRETMFSESTMRKIRLKVAENRELFLDKWREMHG